MNNVGWSGLISERRERVDLGRGVGGEMRGDVNKEGWRGGRTRGGCLVGVGVVGEMTDGLGGEVLEGLFWGVLMMEACEGKLSGSQP